MQSEETWALGIDLGGTKIEAALVSSFGQVEYTSRVDTPKTTDKLKTCLLSLVREKTGVSPVPLAGVGFSIPGSEDPKTRVIRNATNSPEINEIPFFKDLETCCDLPLKVENDANCLVMSEWFFGVARQSRHVVGLILGTGFGSGVLIDGRLLQGRSGLAPELGHIPLEVNGRACLCGSRGCVEAYLSGPSILRRYHENGGRPEIKTAHDLFKVRGDDVADKTLQDTKYLFERFVASLVSMYDPDLICLGGGVAQQKLFHDLDERSLSPWLFGTQRVPEIKMAQHGDASGKLGAAALFFDRRPS